MPCQNHGFVLDGYPETYSEAKDFFFYGTHFRLFTLDQNIFHIALVEFMSKLYLYLSYSGLYLDEFGMEMEEPRPGMHLFNANIMPGQSK